LHKNYAAFILYISNSNLLVFKSKQRVCNGKIENRDMPSKAKTVKDYLDELLKKIILW